ncbi:uncharacterized protein LOC127877977 [Dreissena polymorpha]|uniref:VWFA domain-containing protein n=1 Tax=Dreissena polymorpha TaxID=45954 RepID=A0A9D4KAL8_DREPO|nr:uncharacterized protein LOC127877977 [Dreissena polymorpha]KAH3836091.1 hypothetical protein DPMN_109460 [Dreissena polymorpha]
MDPQVNEEIRGVKDSSHAILNRVNEITREDDFHRCKCSESLEQLTKDLSRLSDRIEKLRLHESTSESDASEFEQRFSVIQSQIDELHQSVLALSVKDAIPELTDSNKSNAGDVTIKDDTVIHLEAEFNTTVGGNVNNVSAGNSDMVATDLEEAVVQETPSNVSPDSLQRQHPKTNTNPTTPTTNNINSPLVMTTSTASERPYLRARRTKHDASKRNKNNPEGTDSIPSMSAEMKQVVSSPSKISAEGFKPNFVVSANRKQQPPQSISSYSVGKSSSSETKLIRQTEKAYLFGDEDAWKSMAQITLDRALQTTGHLDCVVSVLCLDISESMASGNAWDHVREFTNDFLTGLAESKANNPRLKDEYVAVATFGHRTELKLMLTTNYDEVRQQIEGLVLGGPSPLYGGLMMALAGAMSARSASPTINDTRILPKIIVLTDGQPSELMLNAGPDNQDLSKMDHTMAHLVQAVEELDNRGNSLFFLGVGNYEERFIATMTAMSESRKQYTYRDGRRLARRHYLATQGGVHGLLDMSLFLQNRISITKEDSEDMKDIRDEMARRVGNIKNDFYKESNDPTLLRIGSRVRRGPDWRWGNQDLEGPGTVVGHHVPGQVWVTWDLNGQTNVYNYGVVGYQVIPVDEPRFLNHGEIIDVGCTVKPGRDCTSGDIASGNTGVVLKLEDDLKALVKWDNGQRGKYSYGLDGKTEVEVCSSTLSRGQGFTLHGSSHLENEMNLSNSNNRNNKNSVRNTSGTTSSKNKNKNKNK